MENELFNEPKVSKAYIRLSIPLVLSMVVTLIYNLADTFFVAQTDNTNLVAGVSLGMPVFTLLMAIGNIFGQGGSSVISRLLGQKDEKGVRQVSSFGFYITILLGVVIAVIMLIFREPFVYLLGADEDTFFHISSYYMWLVIGAPIVMLSYIHSNFLRAEGMSKESMIGTILGAVVNIVLDPFFISILNFGAAGAAIATVIGYLFSDMYFVIVVLNKSKVMSLSLRETKVPAGHIGQILGIGIPAAIVNIMQSVSAVLVNQFLPGNDKIAAMGIALKVSMIALLLLTGFAFGGQPLFGYYYGSGDKQKLSQLFRFCVRFIALIALLLTVVILIAAPLLIRCFMDDTSVLTDGTMMLRLQVISMVFVGLILLMSIVCQSLGKVTSSFILSISRQGIVFLIVLLIANYVIGYMGVIASQAIADVITAVIAFVIYQKQIKKEFY